MDEETKQPLNEIQDAHKSGLSEGNPDDVNMLNGILMDIANLKRARGGDVNNQTDEDESPLEPNIQKHLILGRASSTTSVFELKKLEDQQSYRKPIGSIEKINNTQESADYGKQKSMYDRNAEIARKLSEREAENRFIKKVLIAMAITAVILLILDLLCIYVFNIEFRNPDTKEITTYQPYLTVDLIILGIVLMVFDIPPEAVMLSVDFLYLITRCQTFQETVNGFANTGVLTVVFLSIAAEGMNETKAMDALLKALLGNSSSVFVGQLRLLITVFILSAFVNNTALVGLFIPLIESWCLTNRLPIRAFLIPMSLTSILGGSCTYIGSTVNLIGFQLATENPHYRESPISFFEIGAVGLPLGVIGIIYLLIFSKCILVQKEEVPKVFPTGGPRAQQAYWIALEVTNIKSKCATDIGLHNVPNAEFKAIIKLHERQVIDGPQIFSHPLYPGDILVYSCGTSAGIVALREFRGLRFSMHRVLSRLGQKRRHRVLFELVVSHNSSLRDKTLKETDFLYRHEACVIAIRRKGVGICRYSYQNFKLKAGDLLLVEAPGSRHSLFRAHYDFQLSYIVPRSKPPRMSSVKDIIRQVVAVVLFIVMILLSIFGTLDIGIAAFFLSLIFVLNKTLTLSQAKAASNPDIYIILAASVGVAAGLTNSGAMNALGSGLLSAGQRAGPMIVIGLIYLCTVILSLVLSTSATAIIMMPIAFQAADSTGMSQKLFIFVIILAASQGFSTPFSYQTNLMVWRPGGYKFCDFIAVGIPLNVILLIVSTILCYYIYGVAQA